MSCDYIKSQRFVVRFSIFCICLKGLSWLHRCWPFFPVDEIFSHTTNGKMSSNRPKRVPKPSLKLRENKEIDSDEEVDDFDQVIEEEEVLDPLERAQNDDNDDDNEEEIEQIDGSSSNNRTTTTSTRTNNNKHAAPWGNLNTIIPLNNKTYSRTDTMKKKIPHSDESMFNQVAYCVNIHLTENMIETITNESNSYATKISDEKTWAKAIQAEPITQDEVRNYVGVKLMHALSNTKNINELFSQKFPFQYASNHLPLSKSRFNIISSGLHCQSDEDETPSSINNSSAAAPTTSTSVPAATISSSSTTTSSSSSQPPKKLKKVGTIMELFQENINNITKKHPDVVTRELVIDEMMICFQGNLGLVYSRQAKPTSMGMKVWALCTRNGYLLHFLLAKGPGKDDSIHDMMLKLIKPIENLYHVVYMDNLFTSVATLKELLRKGVYACGTCRKSRGVPEDLVPDKNAEQGTIHFKMAQIENGTITAYGWMDSGPVRALSTFHDGSTSTLLRRKKGNSERVVVAAPSALKEYNDCYHGVDVSDQMRAALSISRRTRKWWKRLLDWIIDVSFINSYLLFKVLYNNNDLSRRDFMLIVCRMLCGHFFNESNFDDDEAADSLSPSDPSQFTVPSGFLNCNIGWSRKRSSGSPRSSTTTPPSFFRTISPIFNNSVSKSITSASSVTSPLNSSVSLTKYGLLGQVGPDNHLLLKTTMLREEDSLHKSAGSCDVCKQFGFEGNIRSFFYCRGCQTYFHIGCYMLHHTRRTYSAADVITIKKGD
jgi:hypothetical protein